MAEYIERRAAEKAIRDIAVQASDRNSRVYAKAENVIHFVPATDVEPVRHGTWEPVEMHCNHAHEFRCSACKGSVFYDHYTRFCEYDYCPNCGAKMDGGSA